MRFPYDPPAIKPDEGASNARGGCLTKLKLFETREVSLEPQEEVANFRDAVCLGKMSYRKVSLCQFF